MSNPDQRTSGPGARDGEVLFRPAFLWTVPSSSWSEVPGGHWTPPQRWTCGGTDAVRTGAVAGGTDTVDGCAIVVTT